MICNSRKALLHVAKGKLRMTEETCRQALVRIAGLPTFTDLDREGFEAVMGFFEDCGFQPSDTSAPRHGELWREIHRDRACDDEALAGWLRKYQKVDSLRFLTAEGAQGAALLLLGKASQGGRKRPFRALGPPIPADAPHPV